MLPIFGDDTRKRRQINLGGSSSVATQSSLLDQAKARRTERDAQRRKHDGAVRVQAWWKGIMHARAVRVQMKALFEQDVGGLQGLRCLVLIGQDEDALARWSAEMVSRGEEALLRPIAGPDGTSWAILLRRVSLLLLRSVNNGPQLPSAKLHLQVLGTLLSVSTASRVLGTNGPVFASHVAAYLLDRGYYSLLADALVSIPPETKSSSPTLPLLVPLLTLPLSMFDSKSTTSSPERFTSILIAFITQVLTIPSLPYRLPLQSLTHLSSQFPLGSFSVLADTIISIPLLLDDSPAVTGLEKRVNLLVNLITFSPPRYSKLPGPALSAYLKLLAAILSSVPSGSLEAPSATSTEATTTWVDVDSDSDTEISISVSVVSSFAAPSSRPTSRKTFDKRTYAKLDVLPSPTHLSALQAATAHASSSRPAFFAFIIALALAWPSRRENVLGGLLAATGGSIVREVYRGYVRGANVGRDAGGVDVFDPVHASAWPSILLLADLYTHALLTMSDDEFFSSSSGPIRGNTLRLGSTSGASTNSPRNPLTLDELTSLSRQLLNITFSLYWKDDPQGPEAGVPGLGVKWDVLRERLTKCLHAIHARDSRKPFTAADHWLVTTEIDVQLFVEAALFEGQQLSESSPGILRGARQPSKRQIAAFSPRLGVLNNIPFAIPFDVRVNVFRGWIARDMIERSGGSASGGWIQPDRFMRMGHHSGRARAVVRRGQVAQDGFDKLFDADLKAPVEITFIDQFGNEEAGIDGGGVFKEFFTSLCQEVFDTDRGLWLANKQNELYPNPHAYATEAHSLNWYRFIGRILGKALYEGILVDVAFAGFFLAKWLGKQSFLDDLASLDPDLYQGLIFLKNYAGNPEDLSLNFTIAIEEFGVTRTIDLIPNGSNIPVTRENRLQYIYLISHYKLTKQIKQQSDAFFEGLSDIIDPKWLRMFNQQELQVLLGGINAPVDLEDLRANTQYGGLYDDNHQTIVIFWKVAESFNQEQRRQLLRFVTSCSRPPLLGFKELVPKFAIRDAGGDEARLPTSSTCVNLLKLPRYSTELNLRTKLLQAITANAGFDLS